MKLFLLKSKRELKIYFGAPAEAVDINKKHHLYKTAEYFLLLNKMENAFVRFDVIEIFITTNSDVRLSHIKNAIFEKPRYTHVEIDDFQ